MSTFLIQPTETDVINDLSLQLLKAKEAENNAKAERLRLEQCLIEYIGSKEEGTTNFETELYKVKTVGSLTHKLDDEAIKNDWQQIPEELQKCIKFKASLDKKLFRSIESLRDDLIPIANKYITSKPAKTSVKVEAVKENK